MADLSSLFNTAALICHPVAFIAQPSVVNALCKPRTFLFTLCPPLQLYLFPFILTQVCMKSFYILIVEIFEMETNTFQVHDTLYISRCHFNGTDISKSVHYPENIKQ